MNKLSKVTLALLTSGVASGVVMTPAMAADVVVDVYGKVNVALINLDDGTDTSWDLESNASRLGFKGKFDISEGLEAIYQLEYEIAVDDGDTGDGSFKQRNIYAGFKGDFGQIIAGKHDTPVKLAQGKVDLFNDLPLGDIKNLTKAENRESNMVMYTSPKFADGFVANIAVMAGEGADDGAEDSFAEYVSASLKYSFDDAWVAVAVDDNVDGWDVIRLATGYDVTESLTLGLIYEMADESQVADDKEEDMFVVSAKYKMDKFTYKLQYGTAEQDDSTGTLEDETLLSIGVDYKLGKNAKIYSYYSDYSDDADSTDKSAFGVGYEIKF